MAQGYLQVDVVSDANSFPVQDADIVIARTEEPDEIIEETRTNSSGQTENLPLDAPPVELSLSPEETERPYAGDSFAASFECLGRRADRDRDDSGSHTLW